MNITLDPGHGRYKNKGVTEGYYEGSAVFELAYALKDELEKYKDVNVFVTRESIDDDPTLESRGKTAIANGSQLFISLHTNAASSEKAHGVSVFRSIKSFESDALGVKLGEAVANEMRKYTSNTYLRGVMTRTYEGNDGQIYDYYGVIRASVKKGLKYSYIVEHGFHTNKAECDFMASDEKRKILAKVEAKTIAEYFGLEEKTAENTENATSATREYIVQKGDTLSAIAKKYGLSYMEIANYNGISNPDLIFVGQKLLLPEEKREIFAGDRVRIMPYKTTYSPGGKTFPKWVLDYDYIVEKTVDSHGNKVYKNGAECVLLGKKVNRKTGDRSSPLSTWCAKEYLIKVDE